MSRQRLPIGAHGEVTVVSLPDSRVEVRTRYRDFDGKARLVSARAATKPAALAELKKRLAFVVVAAVALRRRDVT